MLASARYHLPSLEMDTVVFGNVNLRIMFSLNVAVWQPDNLESCTGIRNDLWTEVKDGELIEYHWRTE